jgi:hypothetical protein
LLAAAGIPAAFAPCHAPLSGDSFDRQPDFRYDKPKLVFDSLVTFRVTGPCRGGYIEF